MTYIDPHLRPEVWFFQTIAEANSKGIPRARLLSNQLIPSDTEGHFESGDNSLNVNANHLKRKENPVGTVFACLKIGKYHGGPIRSGEPYYRALPEKEIYVVTGQNIDASEAIINAYQLFIKEGKTPRLKVIKPSAKGLTPKSRSAVEALAKKHPCPTPEDHGFYVDPLRWQRLIFNYSKGHNSLLTGPDGTGKSELAVLVANSFGMPIKTFDMGSKMDPIASLIGVHRHSPHKNGSFFDRAEFTYAIEQPNTIILEELSRGPSNANNILFPVLDSRKELSLDIATRDDDRVIKVHSDCRFLATANEGYQYTGTTSLDPALKRRFKIVKTEYMPEGEEVRVLHLRTNLPKRDCETIVKVAAELRNLYKTGHLNTGASTSATLDAAELAFGGFEMDIALELAFLPLYLDEEEKKVLDILMAR